MTSVNSLVEQIYAVIASSYGGIKGNDIALKLGVAKPIVNSLLSKDPTLKALVMQTPDYKWHLLNTNPSSGSKLPKPDKTLNALCNYYLECIRRESSNKVSAYLTSKYALDYSVLSDFSIDPEQDRDAIKLLNKVNSEKSMVAYLGYPIRIAAFSSAKGSFRTVAPVFMFPIDYTGGQVTIAPSPKLNMEIIEKYCGIHGESAAIELLRLETELGMNDPSIGPEIDELTLRLCSIRQWDWAEPIDPYNIPASEPLDGFEDGFYNRVILIRTERPSYTHGLENELSALSKMPEEGFRGTALYSWLKNTFEEEDPQSAPILEVLSLNTEQEAAVDTSLKNDLTIVTGPPGTGKSQVVTDLLVNIAWHGKTALFSSKNNKAVDVVEARINGLGPRPSILRMGSNASASLAEVAESLLNANSSVHDKTEFSRLQAEYQSGLCKANELKQQKAKLLTARNTVDQYEQKYCEIRDEFDFFSVPADRALPDKLTTSIKDYIIAFKRVQKEAQPFFSKLFWNLIKKKRIAMLDECAAAYNRTALPLGFPQAETNCSYDEAVSIEEAVLKRSEMLHVAIEYKAAYKDLAELPSFESLDRELLSLKTKLASTAQDLWKEHLLTQDVDLNSKDRNCISKFVASYKLMPDAVSPKVISDTMNAVTGFFKCWAITSLSVKNRIPFTPALFDYVVIDEASQCDIASMLPLLFRAKRVVVIGDPKQLSHISVLSKKEDASLLERFAVPSSWSYSVSSFYDLAAGKVKQQNKVALKDHFRSCEDIIGFSNHYFYDGSLRTATRYEDLIVPLGEKQGVRWIDVRGDLVKPRSGSAYNPSEIRAVVRELERLIRVGYRGSIGVVTPFRRQAEEIKRILETENSPLLSELLDRHEFDANTVHAFQGDERDFIIFSPVITHNAPASTLGFLKNTGNLFNVAITRARSVLTVIGNLGYCLECDVPYMKSFAEYYKTLLASEPESTPLVSDDIGEEYPRVSNSLEVSDWEKDLYRALRKAGISTVPQYPVDKYRLDLALFFEGKMLDIEVDGERYHRSWNGELCYRDQLRNQRLFELGWDVKRFWVYQVRDDIEGCVREIKEWMSRNS